MSTRDFSWGKGGRCVWLTTYHPCSVERQEHPGPSPTPNPLGHFGPLRDDLYLYLYCFCCCCYYFHNHKYYYYYYYYYYTTNAINISNF